MGPVAAGIVSAALPAVAGLFGGERRNRTDQAEAQKNRDWQTQEAIRNRTFQEHMRNTAWQAGVEDMRAAGLNPALAYSQGPASSPSGSMGGGAQASGAENSVGSAMQLLQQKKQLQLLDAQIKKTSSEAQGAEYAATMQGARWGWLSQEPGSSAYTDKNFGAFMRAELANMIGSGMLSSSNASYLDAQRRLLPFRNLSTLGGSIFNFMRNEGGASMNRLFRRNDR